MMGYSQCLPSSIMSCVWQIDSVPVVLSSSLVSTTTGGVVLMYDFKKW